MKCPALIDPCWSKVASRHKPGRVEIRCLSPGIGHAPRPTINQQCRSKREQTAVFWLFIERAHSRNIGRFESGNLGSEPLGSFPNQSLAIPSPNSGAIKPPESSQHLPTLPTHGGHATLRTPVYDSGTMIVVRVSASVKRRQRVNWPMREIHRNHIFDDASSLTMMPW